MLACVAACWAALASVGGAASSGTVVGANVLSATSLDLDGCQASGALDLGPTPVNTWSIGTPCTVEFGSSNDTARLRMWQRDESGAALESSSRTWTPRSGTTNWNAVAAGSSNGTAWAAGVGGPGEPSVRFEMTTDGGSTWSATGLTTCTASVPIDLDAFSDLDLWAASSTRICHSTDGGQTWTTDYTIPSGTFQHVNMVSPTLGYAVGNGMHVFRTTNGTTWNDLGAIPSASFNHLASIHGDGAGRIVIGARTSTLPTSSYGVVWSANDGVGWNEQVLATDPGVDTYGVFGALVVNPTTLIVSGPNMGTHRGVFAAGSWTWSQVLAGSLSRVPFVRTGDGAIFGVTGGDSAYRSTDAGATWTVLPMATGSSPHQREIAGNVNRLWVTGYTDRRITSNNSGSTWSAGANKPNWYAALAWNASTMFIAGSGGNAIRSTDGGATRTPTALGTAAHIYDGVTWPRGIGVLVGSGSTILRTTDFGVTWSPITSPALPESWSEVTLDDTGVAWIVSATGKVASSSDQGATWTLQTTAPGAPNLQSVGAWRGTIWVGGGGGTVWRSSTTLPLAWTAVPTTRTGTVTSIWAIDATTAVALTDYEPAADNSHMSRTTNGGSTWTSQTAGTVRHTREIAVDDGHRFGWVTGTTNYLASDDRGVTWSAPQSVGVSQYIQRMQPLSGGRMLAVGDASLVSTASATTSVPDGMAGAAGFGACLETASGTASTQWTVAGAGNCSSAIPGNWSAIAVDPLAPTSSIATTPTTGSALLDLRFGLKAGPSTTSGAYAAHVVFETVAPAT